MIKQLFELFVTKRRDGQRTLGAIFDEIYVEDVKPSVLISVAQNIPKYFEKVTPKCLFSKLPLIFVLISFLIK